MNQTTLFRDFARDTSLSVVGTLGVSCYILADTFFISKGLGTNGLAALNLALPVYNFIHGTGLMLGMGGATKFSVCSAQGRQNEGNRIYTNMIYLALLFSAVFFSAGIFFTKPLALLLGADIHVLEMTDTYLRWLLIFAPAFLLNDLFLCFVRNDNAPGMAMFAMLIGSFSNIVLDYLFIFPMQMGIFGAIFATGLSPVISIAMMCPHWIKKRNRFRLLRTKPGARIVVQCLSLGFPSFLAQFSSGIVMISFNAILLGLEGNVGVAAYGVVANISLVVVALYTGMAQGVQPLISILHGKRENKQIKKMMRYALATMLGTTLFLYSVIFFFAQSIASVFNAEKNLELQRIAVIGLKLYFTSSAFAGYNIILATFFTSIEKPKPAHILSMLRGLFLILPMAFLLSAIWQMTGVWFACPITEFLVAALGFVMYSRTFVCKY